MVPELFYKNIPETYV